MLEADEERALAEKYYKDNDLEAAKETSRTPTAGLKRFTAFIKPMLPSWIRSASARP